MLHMVQTVRVSVGNPTEGGGGGGGNKTPNIKTHKTKTNQTRGKNKNSGFFNNLFFFQYTTN